RIQNDLRELNVNNRQQELIVDDIPDDNSFYSPGDKAIHMGTGGVDDGEDADVFVHEYGHSTQDNQDPGFGAGGNEGAQGEGLGDYQAGSMEDVLPAQAGHAEVTDPNCIADWDSTAYSPDNPPCLRRLDGKKHFPEAADGEVHDDGEMWSAAAFK